MTRPANVTRSPVIPRMAYRDARRAIRWLCETFGFVERASNPDEAGNIIRRKQILDVPDLVDYPVAISESPSLEAEAVLGKRLVHALVGKHDFSGRRGSTG